MERIRLHDLEFVPMIGANEITRRVKEMGADITAAYAGQNPLFIGVLNGAFIFAADRSGSLRATPRSPSSN